MKKIICTALLFSSVVMFQHSVFADAISIPGYHEIIFSGMITEFDGTAEFSVTNSSSTYVPHIGDTISIHFGATLYADECCDEFLYTWNHDFNLDIFQIIVNDGLNGYIIDVPWITDMNGYNSSFRDNFWIYYVADVADYTAMGNIAFNHDNQDGYFSMGSSWHADFNLYATLTSSLIITEPSPAPVPEPATLVLWGIGLIGITRIRKRHR